MNLPTYKDASDRLVEGTATNLDRFVAIHEPGILICSPEEIEIWRRELSQAIKEAVRQKIESDQLSGFIKDVSARDFWLVSTVVVLAIVVIALLAALVGIVRFGFLKDIQ